METFRRILVPTDFEASSRRALDVAITLAASSAGDITLLHVYSLPTTPYVEGVAWPLEDFAAAAQKALDAELARAKERYPRTRAVLSSGFAWQQIVDYVSTNDVDLVVMGTHGRRGVSRVLLGSVAEKVVRSCGAPVMVVPEKDARK